MAENPSPIGILFASPFPPSVAQLTLLPAQFELCDVSARGRVSLAAESGNSGPHSATKKYNSPCFLR
ncbi:hypothetical protein BT69DRAFT_1283036 [Atractiella rhizophila]|nr:hypothetical protein BT69DRAFT_1283036 [Atractiella rhizophila]